MTRRPSPLTILREAEAAGIAVRIVYTHAGDMVIEAGPALTDGTPFGDVPPRADETAISAVRKRIADAQRRAS